MAFDPRNPYGAPTLAPAMLTWIEKGAAWRERMIKLGLYMSGIALAMDVPVSTVSSAYHGMIDPEPLIQKWNSAPDHVKARAVPEPRYGDPGWLASIDG